MQYINAQDWINDINVKRSAKPNLSVIISGIILFLGEDISLINSLKQTYTEIKNNNQINSSDFLLEVEGSCDTLFDSCNIHFIDDAIPSDLDNVNSQNSLYVLTSTNVKLWQKYKNNDMQCVLCDKIQNHSTFIQNWSKYYKQEYNAKIDRVFDKYISNLYILKIFWNLRAMHLQSDEIQYILSSYLEAKQTNSKFSGKSYYTNGSLFFYNIFMKKDLVEF